MPYHRTPDQIRESFKRKSLRLNEVAQIDACKRICAHWHNIFGGCYRLDDSRLRLLLSWLTPPPPARPLPAQCICDAIDAYHEYCKANERSRSAEGIAPRSIDSFLKVLDTWLDKGIELRRRRDGQAAQRSAVGAEIAEKRELLARSDYRELLRQAVIELGAGGADVGDTTLNNPRVRARMREIVRRVAVAPRGEPGTN